MSCSGRNIIKARTDTITTFLSSVTIYFTITSILWLLLHHDINLRNSFNDRTIGITVLTGIDASARVKLYVGVIIISIVSFFIYKYIYELLLTRLLNKSKVNLWHTSLLLGSILLMMGVGSIALNEWLLVVSGKSLLDFTIACLPILLKYKTLSIIAVLIFITAILSRYCQVVYKLKYFVGLPFLYLTMSTISVSVLYFLSGMTELLRSLKILLILLTLSGSILMVKYWSSKNRKTYLNNVISDQAIIVFCLVMPFVMIIAQSALLSSEFFFSGIILVKYAIFSLICFLTCFYAMKKASKIGVSQQTVSNSIIVAGILFLLIPLAIPLLNELQYTISGNIHIHLWFLTTSCIIICIFVGIILSILIAKRPIQSLNNRNIIYYIYYPIILVTLVIYKFRQTVLVLKGYDLFHDGETLITNQHLFSFGSIPLINSYPTHGMSDTSYQILYSLINGYQYVEPLLWSWLPKAASIVLLYLLLSKIIDNDFSFIIIIFTPLIAILGSLGGNFYYYYPLFLPALTLYWILQKMDFFRQSIHWSIIVFLFLYRAEFGVLSLVCSLPIIGIYYYKCYLTKELKTKEIRSTILSLGIVFAFFFVLAALMIRQGGESIHDIVSQNLLFLSMAFQDATTSYPGITPNNSLVTLILAFIQYLLLPSVSVIYLVYFATELLFRKKIPSDINLVLLFLASLSLMISVRSLGRHSLIEGYNGYFFVFLALCAPISIFSWKKIDSSLAFVGLMTIFIIFTLPIIPTMHNAVASQSILPADNTNYLNIHDWTIKESRLAANQPRYQVVSFIKDATAKNQTFFDFTNSPMLYVLSNKKNLLYIIPNIYQTSDTIQNISLNKLKTAYDQNEIPIVIFKQGNWWDSVDKVPNEVRSYHITEFIYQNYMPLGNIDNYQIWISRKVNLSANPNNNLNYSIKVVQHFNFMKLPYIWGKYDPKNAVTNTEVLENICNNIISLNGSSETIYFNSRVDKSSGNYLHLSLKSNYISNVSLTYGNNPDASITFVTVPTNDYQDYLIRISTQWVWMNQSIDKLTLTADHPVIINKIAIRKGD